jgi:hypothetical protein
MKKTLLLLAIFVCCDLICQSSGDYRTKSSFKGPRYLIAALLAFFLIGVGEVLGQTTRTSSQTGDWNATTTWVGGVVPASNDHVVIASNHTITVTDNRTCASIVFSGSAGIVSVNTGIALNVTTHIRLNHQGANNSLAILSGFGTISTGSIIVGESTSPTLTAGSLHSTQIRSTVSALNVSGNISLIAGSGTSSRYRSPIFDLNSGTLTLGGTISPTGIMFGDVNIFFRMTQGDANGTLILNNTSPWATHTNLVQPWWSRSASSGYSIYNVNLNGTNATVVYNAPGVQTILRTGNTNAVNVVHTNLTLAGSGVKTLPAHSAAQVSGTLSMQGTATLTTTGTLIYGASSTLEYKGSAAQTTAEGEFLTGASGSLNLIIDNPAGVTLHAARTLRTSGPNTLTLKNGTLNNATNNITMASGSTIEKTNGSLSAAPVFAGTVNLLYSENATGITNSGNEVPTSASVLNNVTLDNSNNVNLNSDMTINGIFDFNAGLLKCQNSKVLTFNQGSSHIGSGGLSYVVGKVSKIGNTAFTFPIGSDLLFRSASISAPSNSTDKFSAQYFRSNPTSLFGTGKDVTLNNVSKLEYWDVSRDAGTSSVSVSLDWESSTSGVTNPSDLRVSHWNSSLSKWEDLGKTNSITASSTSGFVTSNVTSNFSPFTLGSATAINPLPIELYDFDIFCYNNKLKFFWETKSEDNNHFYSILSSSDAINWSVLDTIKSKGNTSIGHQYEFLLDKKIDGKYFRLKQTDYDQKFELFPIKYFDSEMCLNYDHFIYYNQDKRTIIWNLVSDNYYFELIDYTGRVYLSGVTDLNYINTDKLNDGVYIFKLKVNGVHYIKKIVIKKL